MIPTHALGDRFHSPLPLAVYLVGALVVVAASIIIAVRRTDAHATPRSVNAIPRNVARLLGVFGLAGWLWAAALVLAGGDTGERVDDLLLWVYGWVGISFLSILHPDSWRAIDPNRRLSNGLRRLLRRSVNADAPGAFDGRNIAPAALIGVIGIIWLELVVTGGGGGTPLLMGHVIVTAWVIGGRTLAADPDAWAAANDPLTAWFSMLGALRRGAVAWGTPGALLASIAVGSVIFDGLSQGQAFFDTFGLPSAQEHTLLLLAWLALVAGVSVLAMRAAAGRSWATALGEGFVPVAAGYVVAHYTSWLLFAGQRIYVAVGDPLQRGSDLFGTAWFEPQAFLPPAVLWGVQVVAVVAGHILGVQRGHAVVTRVRRAEGASTQQIVAAQLPLAAAVLALTLITLWSLGQSVVVPPA